MSDDRILAIDIGAGTMDVLLYDLAEPMENAVQLVLPSATAIAGKRIAAAREAGRDVFLHGNLMGGYHTTNAVWRHLEAGLRVYATERSRPTRQARSSRTPDRRPCSAPSRTSSSVKPLGSARASSTSAISTRSAFSSAARSSSA